MGYCGHYCEKHGHAVTNWLVLPPGFPSVINSIFKTINEKVTKFFSVSKQAVKDSSTELLTDDSDRPQRKQSMGQCDQSQHSITEIQKIHYVTSWR